MKQIRIPNCLSGVGFFLLFERERIETEPLWFSTFGYRSFFLLFERERIETEPLWFSTFGYRSFFLLFEREWIETIDSGIVSFNGLVSSSCLRGSGLKHSLRLQKGDS
ncbi:hypothetical protein [Leptospira noguchii]|uniref:hypothetical protein n=1 Tax=Leptospira noguchii TaxID=28182 RepID=UPI0012DAEEE9|nr:hypothetical protein [Leptospira noguchii]